ncbi:class I SAM-dependent methyltransferase [Rhizobium tubonense]|uniref:SAM-dependent methyltransferase n=1 Tax=Rhizobium tubonense TaxID=484088 RepID=A0A2W4CNT7_9HYPH|nr:class I SAM-dependent methyltransferase [Rhizobium tubonense]PZM12548.1 SAM-dependent methyltransferase [Rhizobium tubonense]
MSVRHIDGSAGDANYGTIGKSYSSYRQPDPRIAAVINDALGNAGTVLNVGAGAGSYEPTNRDVTAVEPSASMRAQRPAHLSVAIDAVAENLPFPDKHFDAAMGTFTIHQWPDLKAGLGEMRRVTRGPVLILTCDPNEVQSFWLNDYAPDVLSTEARRYPSMAAIREGFGAEIDILPMPIPLDCRDGFNEAYYGRPEMLLEDGARLSCSAWSFVTPEVAKGYIDRLRTEIEDGRWDEKYGELRTQPEFHGSLYLVISRGMTGN